MFTKLTKLEAKLGNIDLDDFQILDVDSPDHIYLQLLGNFEKKYGDSYRLSDWLGDVREKLLLVLLLKIEALSHKLDTPSNIPVLLCVCDTVRICLREKIDLAAVQVEHFLSSAVRILQAQVTVAVSTSVLRMLLNTLIGQPARMMLFVSGKIQGVQCLNGLIRFGHREDGALVSHDAEAKDVDPTLVSPRNPLSDSEKHEMHVKVIHHAVRIVFMMTCEEGRLLTHLRGFRTLTVACSKRLFFCLSNHNPRPKQAQQGSSGINELDGSKKRQSRLLSPVCCLADFPYSDVNAQLFSDLIKVLYALDNIFEISSSSYISSSAAVSIRSFFGHPEDVDNTVEDAQEVAVRVQSYSWRTFLHLAEKQASAFGVAEPVTGTRVSVRESGLSALDTTLRDLGGAAGAEVPAVVVVDGGNAPPLGDDERAMNAASLDEVRVTLLSKYMLQQQQQHQHQLQAQAADKHSAKNDDAEISSSSTRTLVRVMQAAAAMGKTDSDRFALCKDEKEAFVALDVTAAAAAAADVVVDAQETTTTTEVWSALSLVALVTSVVLTLGPCHLQPPLLFADDSLSIQTRAAQTQRHLLSSGNNSVATGSQTSHAGGEGRPASLRLEAQSAAAAAAAYRQVYQLVVGRLSEVEETALQLTLLLPERLLPSLFLRHLTPLSPTSTFPSISTSTSTGAESKQSESIAASGGAKLLSSLAAKKSSSEEEEEGEMNIFDCFVLDSPDVSSSSSSSSSNHQHKANSMNSAASAVALAAQRAKNRELAQPRQLLTQLCSARTAWLPDSLFRVLYRLLLKTHTPASSASNNTGSGNSNSNNGSSGSSNSNSNSNSSVNNVVLIPCMILLTKIARMLAQATTPPHAASARFLSLALRNEIDNVRFALKYRVFPTLFDRHEHLSSSAAPKGSSAAASSSSSSGVSANTATFSFSNSLKTLTSSSSASIGSSRRAAAAVSDADAASMGANNHNHNHSNNNNGAAGDQLAPWDCPADTLRHELVSRMTSIACEGNLARVVSELLFELCEQDKDEFKVRTGFGNAIHLMQLKGLL